MTTCDYEASLEGLPSAERRLWAAVVFRVIADLLFPGTNLEPAARRRALTWLTTASGDLAIDRRLACTFAGIDGDLLRNRIVAILDGDVPFDYFPGVRNTDAALQEARAMWRAQQRTPAPKPVSRVAEPAAKSIVLPKVAVANPPFEDDPFFVGNSGHILAARSWTDGEVSLILGPLPPRNSNLGKTLWAITQKSRVGQNALIYFGERDALVRGLADALPTCDVCWVLRGERLPAHKLGASLRVYPKQVAQAAK
ncbi:MAG: hypothetical protein MUE52_00320 [Tabrizicola sp.]|jgi:hypothetical protein|nr:hypothetical protein [Tabrizicola sp.]